MNSLITRILISIVLSSYLLAAASRASEIEIEDEILKEHWKSAVTALKADPHTVKSPVNRLLLGHACLALKKHNEAQKWFNSVRDEGDFLLWADWNRTLLNRHPYNPVAIYLTADAMYRIGKTEKAIEGLKLALIKKEDFDLALEALKRFTSGDFSPHENTNGGNYGSGGYAYDSGGGGSRNPQSSGNSGSNNNPGSSNSKKQYSDDEYKRAISGLKDALEIDRSKSETYRNRGRSYYNLGEYDKALTDYAMALQINPNYAEAYNERGIIYYDIGHVDKALEDFSSAIRIDPKFASAYINRGVIYFEVLGEIDSGCADWQEACKLGQCSEYNKAKRDGYCQ